jgi:hypothetical protein
MRGEYMRGDGMRGEGMALPPVRPRSTRAEGTGAGGSWGHDLAPPPAAVVKSASGSPGTGRTQAQATLTHIPERSPLAETGRGRRGAPRGTEEGRNGMSEVREGWRERERWRAPRGTEEGRRRKHATFTPRAAHERVLHAPARTSVLVPGLGRPCYGASSVHAARKHAARTGVDYVGRA